MRPVNWIASYPKSGNTWLRFMLASYITKEPVTSVKPRKLNSLIPAVGGASRNRDAFSADRTGPLLVKTHSLPGASAVEPFRADTSKAVYLVRNPRDIILSLIGHAGLDRGSEKAHGVAEEFITNHGIPLAGSEWEWGNWPQSVLGWTSPAAVRRYFPDADVLTVRYEDMRADPAATLYRIVDFLDFGEPVDQQAVGRAVQSSALENMRALEARKLSDSARPKPVRVGQGRHGQSLTCLGPGIEEAYQQLFQDDNDFSIAARQFGYDG
jgi:hypothetical protein